MVSLGMILTKIVRAVAQWWNGSGFRVSVLSSLVANLAVALLSGTRRRLVPDWWWGAVVFILWFAYQIAEVAATSAVSSVSLCGTDASEEEKQVVALWAPFLLLHLAGPDNLSAYALEENKLSVRKRVEIPFMIMGASYTIYDNIHGGGGRGSALLLAASLVMLVAGAARLWERVKVLGNANLDNMQEDASSHSSKEDDVFKNKMVELKSRIEGRRWRSNGEALLLAQDLFPIWRHALVDSSVNPNSKRQEASETILSSGWDWESMCKVVEMELSLIYDLLYTKVIRANTLWYCLIRLLSPLCTAAATLLFSFWLHLHPQGHRVIRGSFVRITYALLVITFVMDVVWLLRALGSTWAYAYLRELEQAPPACQDHLHRHQAAGGRWRWWCSLHRIVVRLEPVKHRRWSGTIGLYNLLDECTCTRPRQCCPDWLVSLAGDRLKEMPYLDKVPKCVKKELVVRVRTILNEAIDKDPNKDEKKYTRVDIRMLWGHKVLHRPGETIWPDDLLGEDAGVKVKVKAREEAIFGQEFEEDVLMWHIATCMVLANIPRKEREKHARAIAIEVMSEYMMFLVALRRQMLPGLVLHSQLQVTRETLEEMWRRCRSDIETNLTSQQKLEMENKDKLAMIVRLYDIMQEGAQNEMEGNEGTRLLMHARELYFKLSGDERPVPIRPRPRHQPEPEPVRPPAVRVDKKKMLEFMFEVWVDKLVYAAVRCSRDAHAKQLSAGGDLTTVLWMLIQHAGPFTLGEQPPNIGIRFPPWSPPRVGLAEPGLPQAPPPVPLPWDPAVCGRPHPWYPQWPPTEAPPPPEEGREEEEEEEDSSSSDDDEEDSQE